MEPAIEILLVEDDKNMCEAFEFCIRRNKRFSLAAQTGSQREGLEILRKGKMGVVILDLELEEGDGINFLKDMRELPIEKPLVVVITNSRSQITLDCIRANGADFVCQKNNESYSPEMVLSIIEHTYPFRSRHISPQMKVISYQQNQEKIYHRNRIEEELEGMGFKSGIRSTVYLTDAIYYVAYENKEPDCEMKTVYSVVGKKNNTKGGNVEKAIRDSIEKVWDKTAPGILEKYYPYQVSKDHGAPTNMEFVKNMARKIRNHLI